MSKSCNGHVPSSVGGHAKAKKRPNTVVMEGGYKYGGCAASSKYVRPCPLVQMVIDVVYITVVIIFF